MVIPWVTGSPGFRASPTHYRGIPQALDDVKRFGHHGLPALDPCIIVRGSALHWAPRTSVGLATSGHREVAKHAMAVKLRLKRMGRRHRAFFRLAAMDGRAQRDGRVLEELGTYDPVEKDKEKQVQLNAERIQHWLNVGAVPTETVASLLKKQGITSK